MNPKHVANTLLTLNPNNCNSFSRKQLQDLAIDLGIPVPKTMDKDLLCNMLLHVKNIMLMFPL